MPTWLDYSIIKGGLCSGLPMPTPMATPADRLEGKAGIALPAPIRRDVSISSATAPQSTDR